MSLDDLILISDNRLKCLDFDNIDKETAFDDTTGLTKCQINDTKLEKKVTFARLLNKVSAEMSSGSEVDIETVKDNI